MREHRAGSSPRVRGKPARVGARGLVAGLIPACAGKTAGARGRGRAATAHPRVCGENWVMARAASAPPGSSPRVRGKPVVRSCARRRRGLIPACAGKTRGRPFPARACPAHPRVCGENRTRSEASGPGGGSSPRVRGKHPPVLEIGGPVGLIPACAGKTPRTPNGWKRRRAHPRVCGENPVVKMLVTPHRGSSPRVRGKLDALARVRARDGLIPARAGKI